MGRGLSASLETWFLAFVFAIIKRNFGIGFICIDSTDLCRGDRGLFIVSNNKGWGKMQQ